MSDAPQLPLVEVLHRTEAYLRERGVPSPRLDAELLIGHVLALPRLQLYLEHDRPMNHDELAALRPLVARRGKREPVAYITGSRGFHRIELLVRPGVLVPRPDTEALVEAALDWIGQDDADPVFVADVGTGSGAIACAVAAAQPRARVYATDLSPVAIEVAKANVQALDLTDRVAVLRGALLHPIPEHRPIDWVLSNPPYIPSRDIPTLEPEVSVHEPTLALDGGRDGLEVILPLIAAARARARRGLLMEVGHDQAERVSELVAGAGFTGVRTWDDLGGHTRVVGGLISGETSGSPR